MKLKHLAMLAVLAFAASPLAAQEKKVETFTDPAQAPISFKLQGEFTGPNLGVQVIALGKEGFRAVVYNGGLPGDGWDGKAKKEIHGQLEGEKAVFNGLTDDGQTLTGNINGQPVDLKKVERKSPTLGAKAPAGAIILFDGSNADQWEPGRMTPDHNLIGGCKSKQKFTDFTAHVEFYLPFMPDARGQGRGNSGVYLQDRYEIQVLDSFGLKGENNECGGIYTVSAPSVNMCYPPLVWQTYDIDFTAAKYDANGQKTADAVTTIKHNGVTIQDNTKIPHSTGGGQKEANTPGPIQLQNHGNPVVFRNIWVVEKK